MTNREKCLSLINSFDEDQLAKIIVMLESAKTLAEEAADAAFCLRLYADYQAAADKGDTMPLADYAHSLGVDLS